MFARYLLYVFCLVAISCGADRDIVEDEFSDGGGDVPEVDSLDSYSGDIPVVTFAIDEIINDRDKRIFWFYLEVDRSLAHDLFVYVEQKRKFRKSSPFSTGEALLYIPAGKTKSWLYLGNYSASSVLMMRILPADMRRDIELPTYAIYGIQNMVPLSIGGSVTVPLDHRFKPYQVGNPSQITLDKILKEIERR